MNKTAKLLIGSLATLLLMALVALILFVDLFRKSVADHLVFAESIAADLAKTDEKIATFKKQVAEIQRAAGFAGGFRSWSQPETEKPDYFLVLASIRGTAIQPEEPDVSYHIVYDLGNHKYAAMQNTGDMLGGRDFILEIRADRSGSLVKTFHTGAKAQQIMDVHGVKAGSTR